MNYPNGKKFITAAIKENKRKITVDNFGNRGMGLEGDINLSNNFYNETKRALIYKRPTPIKVLKMDKVDKSKITEGFFSSKSTTDYNGVYKGRYLDFEAKETISRTSFPIANIRTQQITHLKSVIEQKGIAFFIIRMKAYNETYLLDAKHIITFCENAERKSIPYIFIKDNGCLIKESFSPRIMYLDAVDKVFFN